MRVNNFKDLEKEIMKRINFALDEDVADTVKDVMTDHIIQDVYEAYEPKQYIRRENQSGNDVGGYYDDTDNTGLLDPNNIISTIDGEGGLSVQNITLGSRYYYKGRKRRVSPHAGEPIAEVIETGKGYDVWKDAKPRPFMQNTHDDLKDNNFHIKALKEGLRKQGLEVK